MQRCCPSWKIPEYPGFEASAALFKALGDPYRLTILATLTSADEVCVCDFTAALPLNQPTVSHHLRVLRDAGLVTCERRGTWVYYQLAPDALERLNDAQALVFRHKVPA
jgi:ArsR family transcriptional regulator